MTMPIRRLRPVLGSLFRRNELCENSNNPMSMASGIFQETSRKVHTAESQKIIYGKFLAFDARPVFRVRNMFEVDFRLVGAIEDACQKSDQINSIPP